MGVVSSEWQTTPQIRRRPRLAGAPPQWWSGLGTLGGESRYGEIIGDLVEEVKRCHAALAQCQADLLAVHGALPSWCGDGTLAERVASVVRVANQHRIIAKDIRISDTRDPQSIALASDVDALREWAESQETRP